MNSINVPKAYTIRKIEAKPYDQVIAFVMKIRKEVFPMLSSEQLPQDLDQFEQHYVLRKNAAFFAAIAEDGSVLGTIGICPYDGRLKQIEGRYDLSTTAEVVKCYTDSTCRRSGIGTALFEAAASFSRDAGYETLYLHTHAFLPGAIPFWTAKGFTDRLAEEDPVWQTLHMDMTL
ncbi:GNAT family N-acetyltransferase [Paenibacillus sp. PDC88]|uniref:GNAT family N-acetyltransferase n=1 Tax=Paenibacillus sp. PDC88 TaxID=1884375 RepID=UPI00089C22C8|nr:GNAT family N-acetyltransferase [Paenibacillus sp. PDC88]SDW71274.1 Acetyltransferase (GNAT) family protein [Paenibacillus sp. PDC88]